MPPAPLGWYCYRISEREKILDPKVYWTKKAELQNSRGVGMPKVIWPAKICLILIIDRIYIQASIPARSSFLCYNLIAKLSTDGIKALSLYGLVMF